MNAEQDGVWRLHCSLLLVVTGFAGFAAMLADFPPQLVFGYSFPPMLMMAFWVVARVP